MKNEDEARRQSTRGVRDHIGVVIKLVCGLVGLILLIPIVVLVAVFVAALDTEDVQKVRRQT
jgi:hypothetical protein